MGLRNGDKYYLWEDSQNPSSLLGTEEFESDDLCELYQIASTLVHAKDGCWVNYTIYIEDRYLEETVDVCSNIP
jgi:hypothetical protein